MKKALAIGILGVLAYSQLGYFGQVIVQQWMLQEEAREARIAALPDACFFRVRLAEVEAAGHWTEAGRECWYNHHLYDVIRRKTEDGVVWLYCMDDEREASLIQQSGEVTRDNQGNPGKKANHSLSPRIGDWLAETMAFRINRPFAPADRRYGDRPRSLCVGWKETFVPPPRS